MLCAEEPDLVGGLLLPPYPLHPPRKPEQLRVQRLLNCRCRPCSCMGRGIPSGRSRDGVALKVIPAKTELLKIDGAGHDWDSRQSRCRKSWSQGVRAFRVLFNISS